MKDGHGPCLIQTGFKHNMELSLLVPMEEQEEELDLKNTKLL